MGIGSLVAILPALPVTAYINNTPLTLFVMTFINTLSSLASFKLDDIFE